MKKGLTALEDASNSLNFIYLTHPQGQGTFIAFQFLFHRSFGATGQMEPRQC